MPLVRSHIALLIGTAALVASGCAPLTTPAAKSPLHRVQMSADSVALDIFFVHCPLGEPEINESLWNEIDEQQLPADLRQRLLQNGFRVGLVCGQIPTSLAQLMELSATPAPNSDWQDVNLDQFDSDQKVTGHHLQARAGKLNEIVVSGRYPQLPLLMPDRGIASGSIYQDAQGFLALRVFLESDGRIRLSLLPELHYGAMQAQITGSNGMLRMEPGQPHRSFDNLAVAPVLSPGQLLVMTCLPTRPGSLGYQFFTRQDKGKTQQKLLLVRLAQTQHQGLFSPDQPLDLSGK